MAEPIDLDTLEGLAKEAAAPVVLGLIARLRAAEAALDLQMRTHSALVEEHRACLTRPEERIRAAEARIKAVEARIAAVVASPEPSCPGCECRYYLEHQRALEVLRAGLAPGGESVVVRGLTERAERAEAQVEAVREALRGSGGGAPGPEAPGS